MGRLGSAPRSSEWTEWVACGGRRLGGERAADHLVIFFQSLYHLDAACIGNSKFNRDSSKRCRTGGIVGCRCFLEVNRGRLGFVRSWLRPRVGSAATISSWVASTKSRSPSSASLGHAGSEFGHGLFIFLFLFGGQA